MILKKVAVPIGVDPKSYWEEMLLGITNDKYCSLRSNFKQEMFEQFQCNVDLGLVESPFQHTCLKHLQDCVVNGD
jgi:hypothetical protein